MTDLPPGKSRRTLPDFAPVPRLTRRHDGWTAERQRGFIEALADLGSVRAAAHAVGMTPESAYQLRRHPEARGFGKAWEAALALGVRRLEDVAMERALNGVEVPVYSHGEEVGTRRVFNDRLLMFLLRNRSPRRFAADSLANAGASTRSHLARLKREWRAEWEAQQEADAVPVAEIQASIERKVAAALQRVADRNSPRAYELRLTIAALNRADEEAGWRHGMDYAPFAARAAELLPRHLEDVRREWPQPRPLALPAGEAD